MTDSWTAVLVAHVSELHDLRVELSEIKKAILQARADSAEFRQPDARWKRDDSNLVATKALIEDQLDLEASIDSHLLAIETVRLFIDLRMAYQRDLDPPPFITPGP